MGEVFISLFAAAVAIFPIYLISKQLSMSSRKQEKAKKKAIERGHVVLAHLVKVYIASRDNPRRSIDHHSEAVYSYEFNGKEYKYSAFSDSPPQTLQLYFLTNPKKASIEGDIPLTKFPWPVAYAIVAVLSYLVVRS